MQLICPVCPRRLFIWLGSLCTPATSRMRETLQFILDHPRRVYIYLCVAVSCARLTPRSFPSYQTWLLVAVLVLLNGIDWFFFVILDIARTYCVILPDALRAIQFSKPCLCTRSVESSHQR